MALSVRTKAELAKLVSRGRRAVKASLGCKPRCPKCRKWKAASEDEVYRALGQCLRSRRRSRL